MTMRGPICRATSERSCARGCSGTAATAARSSPRRASPTRTATAARSDGEVLAATGQPYVEALETRRYDAGAVGQFLVKGRYVMTARAAPCAPEPRSSVWRSPGARSPRYRLRGSGRSWNCGPPDVGCRPGDRTRRLHGARRTAVRLHVHGAGSIRPVRRQRDAGIVGLVEWPAGRPQRVRHLLQSSRVGAGARRTMDEQTVGRNRLLRAHAHHGRNRSRRPDTLEDRAPARSRARVECVVRPVPHRRTPVIHGDTVRIPHQ